MKATSNKPITKYKKAIVLSNLLFAYTIMLWFMLTLVGWDKLGHSEQIGFLVSASLLATSSLFWLSWNTFSLLKKAEISNHCIKMIIFMWIPIIGSVLIYILFHRHTSLKRLEKKEGISAAIMLVYVTATVVLIVWMVYAIQGHVLTNDIKNTNPIQYLGIFSSSRVGDTVTIPIQSGATVGSYFFDANKIYGQVKSIDSTQMTLIIVNPYYVIPGVLDVVLAPIKGFAGAADIIIYLFIMGAFLQVVNSSKALEAGIGRLTKALKGKELILIPIFMFLFSIGGATFGMCEETIAFYPIVMPIIIAAGFDGIVGVLTILFGAGLGVCSSIINPFMILTSVDATNAELNLGMSISDGIILRILIYLIFLTIGIIFVTLYARKIKKNPKISLVYDLKNEHIKTFKFKSTEIPELTGKRKATLIIFMMSFVMLILGAIPWEDMISGFHGFTDINNALINAFPFLVSGMTPVGTWDVVSFAMLFLVGTIVVSALNWQGANNFYNNCIIGAKDFMNVGIVIAIARGLSLILSGSGFGNMVSGGIGNVLGINHILGIIVMFLLFIIISIFIPSTSGFAYAVFGPIAAPALYTNGYSIATGIASTSMANGLVNLVSPTAGPFVIGCEMAKVPLNKFYKSAWKLLLILFATAMIILIVSPYLGSAISGKTYH